MMSGLLLRREGCRSRTGRLRVNIRRREGVSCRECRGGADEQAATPIHEQISAEMVQKLMKERDQALEREKEALKKVGY